MAFHGKKNLRNIIEHFCGETFEYSTQNKSKSMKLYTSPGIRVKNFLGATVYSKLILKTEIKFYRCCQASLIYNKSIIHSLSLK